MDTDQLSQQQRTLDRTANVSEYGPQKQGWISTSLDENNLKRNTQMMIIGILNWNISLLLINSYITTVGTD